MRGETEVRGERCDARGVYIHTYMYTCTSKEVYLKEGDEELCAAQLMLLVDTVRHRRLAYINVQIDEACG